jgi:hypothetical protein
MFESKVASFLMVVCARERVDAAESARTGARENTLASH